MGLEGGEQPCETAFGFYGIGVTLIAPARFSAVVQEAEHFWARYSFPSLTSRDLTITLHAPQDWRPFEAMQRPGAIRFGELQWYYENGRRILWEPGVVMVAHPDRLDVFWAPAAVPDARTFVRFTLNLALIEALRERGLFYVHAACLRSPAGKSLLISADAMQGKSTLTVSLLAAGYAYLSDDAVFVDTRHGRRVHGYAKPFHLGNDVAARFAGLTATSGAKPFGSKIEIEPERLFPGTRLRSIDQVDVLLLPRLTGEENTTVEPVTPLTALTHLFQTSTQVFFDKTLAPAHLAALRAVVSEARAYAFHAGLDVYRDPALYARLLENL